MPTIKQKQEVQAMIPRLKEIYDKFAVNGKVPWGEVFALHPEWARELKWNTHQKRCWAVLTRMRKAGLVGKTKPAPVASAASVASTGFAPEGVAKVIEGNGTQADLLKTLIQQYHQGGAVRFAQAFKEHPEWVKPLGADTESGRKSLYSRGRMIQIEMGLITPKPYVRRNTSKAIPKVVDDLARQEYSDGIPHCPECGCAMAAWNRAYNASKNRA